MPPWLIRRVTTVRTVLSTPWRVGLAFFGVVAAYDTVLSQFVPDEFAKSLPKAWRVAMLTGGLMPWWAWLLILATLFAAACLEYAVRRSPNANPLTNELPSQQVAAQPILPRKDLKPDWPIRELADYIAKLSGSDLETGIGKIHKTLIAGKLKCFGKLQSGEPFAEIDAGYWAVCRIWTLPGDWRAFVHGGREGFPAYSELHVNKEQALNLWPDADFEFCTIHEVIIRIAVDTYYEREAGCPRARQDIRQKAADGKITIRGRKQIAEKVFSELFSDIPKDFWADHSIVFDMGKLSRHLGTLHTRREHGTPDPVSDGYADLRIRREEASAVWPQEYGN